MAFLTDESRPQKVKLGKRAKPVSLLLARNMQAEARRVLRRRRQKNKGKGLSGRDTAVRTKPTPASVPAVTGGIKEKTVRGILKQRQARLEGA
jgi:hypothetical protein